jgi:hypothetical protein
MEARTVNNLPPAAAHDDALRCLLAIELSKKSWIVAVNTPLSDKISRYKLKAPDWKELLKLIEQTRTRQELHSYLISRGGSFVLTAIWAAFGGDILANQVEILIVEHNSIVAASRQVLLGKREQPF